MKNAFQRIACMALAVAATFSLAACSNESKKPRDTKPDKAEQIKSTDAVQVGDRKLSAVELNYFYVDEVDKFCSQYSTYLSYMVDVSKSIGDQYVNGTDGPTWADNFLDMTITTIQDTYALYNAAKAANYKLPADKQTELNTTRENMKTYASAYGYGSTNDFLVSIYGNGANEKSYFAYLEVVEISNAYYNAYSEELKASYSPAQLRDFEKDAPYNYNAYSYISYLLPLDAFKTGGTETEGGQITYTDDQMTQFRAELKAAAESLAVPQNNTRDALNAAIAQLQNSQLNNPSVSISSVTECKDILYTGIVSELQPWLRDDERRIGDITMIARTDRETTSEGEVEVVNGYYIVIFNGMNKNEFDLVNVRQIMITSSSPDPSTGQFIYTEAQKDADRKQAENIYNEWKAAGKLDEQSFTELAKKHNTDPGSKENGGLYEDVRPGQMIPGFEDWCFAEGRQPGDTGIVETMYGYHIMFYVGTTGTSYRDYLVTQDKHSEDLATWRSDLIEKTTVKVLTGDYINRDLKFNTDASNQDLTFNTKFISPQLTLTTIIGNTRVSS